MSHPNPLCPVHDTDEVLIGCPCNDWDEKCRSGEVEAVQLVKQALLESWIEGQQWPNREAWAEHHAKIAVQALL